MPVCDLEIIARLRNSVDRTLILILLVVIVDERLGGGCRNRSRVERRKRCGRGITVFFLPLCFRKRRRASETRTRFCGLNLTEGERYTYVQKKYWMESGSVRGMLTTRSNGQMRRYWQLSSSTLFVCSQRAEYCVTVAVTLVTRRRGRMEAIHPPFILFHPFLLSCPR